ncbi:GyrI-like domain-containing protein [Flavobacterium sp.]|uniref:GyrI-like domain-containing protein n=1 Tax=Flavobacterium sp. TaxID=239 RepID=UPI00286B0AFE|nr:GyrI-like domain-containing protein [Flavobacterium sp.]
MKPRIEQLAAKKLIGKRIIMSLAENKTFDLWKSFMPHRKEITNNLTSELVSMKVYHEPLRLGDMHQQFEKWAAIEVTDFDTIPNDMEAFDLVGGLYAVFDYKGLNTDIGIFIYIFKTWLPNSEYMLDERPHFEILGEKYKNNDPDSEEAIWIPIKLKSY